MKKLFLELKNNKKLMNWIIISGLTLIIGISLILNFIYIPKYYNSKSNLNQFTEVIIDVTEGQDPNKPDKIDIKPMQYNTNLNNLSDLLKSDKNHFIVTSSTIGDYLSGVIDNNGKQIPVSKNHGWIINYWDNNKNDYEPAPAGMDFMPLHNQDKYRLSLESWN